MAGRLIIDDDNHPVPGGVTTLGNILSDTTIVTGSVNAKAVALVDAFGNQIGISSAPSVVEIGDGTNTANILKSDGTAAGQNAMFIAGTGYTTGEIALSASTQNTQWFDMLDYAWVAVEVYKMNAGGSVTFQTSGDVGQSHVNSAYLYQTNSAAGVITSQTFSSADQVFHGPRSGRYFRVSSSFSGGQVAKVNLTFFTVPSFPQSLAVGGFNFTTAVNAGTATNVLQIGASNGSGNVPIIVTVNGAADGTTSPLAVGDYLFNGTNFDRNRNNYNTTTGDTPTIVSATTTNGATQTNYNAKGAIITCALGTVSGTTPALQLQLQVSYDGGTTWLNYGAATTSLLVATGNTSAIIIYPTALPSTILGTTNSSDNAQINAPLPRTWRVQFITTGTGISIAVASVNVQYMN